jgi:hypothetical protein
MFIGHFAVGFAAKKAAPKASLGALMAAPILADLLWPVFLLLGWEQVRIDPGNTAFTPLDFVSYPISHSLLTTLVWAAGFAILYHLRTRYTPGTVLIGLGVVSHWVFDAIVHRPDLPLYPGGAARVGLGLWNSPPATVGLEGVLFMTGVWLYIRTTRPRDRAGLFGFLAFVVVLMLLYVAVIFGPPPPNVKTIAVTALGSWLIIPWVAWFDRHRIVRGPSPRP